jgi:acyl-CoA synthetase (AMP-forming)/AMP-acid ligase II
MSVDYTSLVDALQHRVAMNGSTRAYTFLADGERESARLSYTELDCRARAIAVALAERGVRPGARALLLYPPGLDFIAAFFGCLYAGVIAVPAYPPHPAQVARAAPRLTAVTMDAEVAVVLANACIAPMKDAIARHAPPLAAVPWIVTDEIDHDAGALWHRPRINRDSLAFLQYTSGSTAAPRGVMISHANLLHNLGYAHYVEENDETSVSVSWLPVIHDMGLIEGVLQPVYAGYPAYLMAPAAFLQRPARWLQAITRYGATNSGGPNFAYDLCVRKIGADQRETIDLSTWRVAYNGAEPIRRDTLIAFHAAFRDRGFRWRSFYPVYGLAEATLVVSSGRRTYEPVFRDVDASALRMGRLREPAGAEPSRFLVSSGPVSFGTTVLIVDPETQAECERDQVGEIWVASPSVARGYWRRVGETEHAFDAHLRDGRGPFLRTGDLGVVVNGELIVTGRLKDLLIVRGLKHYPQDIELTVEGSHRAVRPGGSAAFALDSDDGEGVAIAVEIDPRRLGRETLGDDVHDVVSAIRQRVAEQHGIQLRAISILSLGTLPKTSSGKVRRQATRAAFDSETLGEIHRWARPCLDSAEHAATVRLAHPRAASVRA